MGVVINMHEPFKIWEMMVSVQVVDPLLILKQKISANCFTKMLAACVSLLGLCAKEFVKVMSGSACLNICANHGGTLKRCVRLKSLRV